MPSVEAETNLGAGPAEPADLSSSPEVRNDGDDKDDVALADAPLGDCSRPCEPTSLPTPVKENAKKQKPPAGISRSTPKLSPELMRIVLNSLRKYPVLWHAASKAGIHRKTLEYWIRCSAAGHDEYDIKWQGIEWRFEHCELAIWEAELKLLDMMFERAFFGYDKVLTHRGRVIYKIDQGLVDLGCQGPDAYLRDENGNPVPETVHKVDTKAQLSVLKRLRANRWGKHSKIDGPREGGVLVIGDVTKKPKSELLLRTLLAWLRGEPRVCSMVPPESHPRRRLGPQHRARDCCLRGWMVGLLASALAYEARGRGVRCPAFQCAGRSSDAPRKVSSGGIDREQGIGKAGNRRVRTVMVE